MSQSTVLVFNWKQITCPCCFRSILTTIKGLCVEECRATKAISLRFDDLLLVPLTSRFKLIHLQSLGLNCNIHAHATDKTIEIETHITVHEMHIILYKTGKTITGSSYNHTRMVPREHNLPYIHVYSIFLCTTLGDCIYNEA